MDKCLALLVGITNYSHYVEVPPVKGAQADLNKVENYLLQTLSVPSCNIRRLEESNATRNNIIHAFKEHLIDNPEARDESAFIFYYTGHGTQVPSPDGWPTAHDGENHVEMILPFDVCKPQDDNRYVCGIPDRTLGALLDELARKHGTNITVIMDCCYSGHGTREEDFPFDVRSANLEPQLESDTDRDIWGTPSKAESIFSPGKKQRGLSHVLLSASRKDQLSYGNTRGGFFTMHLIDTLENGNIKPPTYGEIVAVVDTKLNEYFKIEWPQGDYAQNPQCEGAHDRIIFQLTRVDPRSFKVAPHKNCHPSISIGGAGAALGVKPGTIFDIYRGNPDTMEPLAKLGTAKATEVEAHKCDADLENDTQLSQPEGSLIIAQIRPNYSLKYAIVDRSEAQSSSTDQVTPLRNKLAESSDLLTVLQEVKDPDEADVVLEVKGGTVTLIHHDRDGQARLSHILPVMLTTDTGHLKVLNGVARFNFFLSHENVLQSGDTKSQVNVELHLLAPYDTSGNDAKRALDKKVDPKDDAYDFKDASDLSEEPEYAFVLHNNSSTDLYVYVVFYDPQTYKIELVYKPGNENEAPLLKDGLLQIGGSPEYNDAFAFYLEKGTDKEVGFFRIFFSPDSLQMGHLEQSAMVTTSRANEDGLGRSTEDDDEKKEDKGSEAFQGEWGCVTRRFVVRKN
ncbi:hypothetical protein NLI96_g5550 [Meripilus lineatus]|uniref:Peptidase C14 caspase domain-containing protein n=1 Tax=Meripilus lineatus TaxID=2056292 RepID=A0AAD5V839_9APHY|nr:hypothetical protein NLI96_g5550 [Physisporinus lineatus]